MTAQKIGTLASAGGPLHRMNKLTLVILLVLVVNVIGVRRHPPFVKAFGTSATSAVTVRSAPLRPRFGDRTEPRASASGDTEPSGHNTSSASSRALGTYTTHFPLAENPISERGAWEGGKTLGLDWADVATIPGRAFGLESGVKGYDDATALLTGNWGPNQTAQATVYTVNQNDKIYEEVELRLRSSLSAHNATGYEVLFRCSKTNDAYAEIVRWNGPLGDFTYLDRHKGAQYGVANGDVVKATIAGKVITAYINGVQVARATDGTYATGRPGMGFFLQGATGVNRDYGFTSFMASDER